MKRGFYLDVYTIFKSDSINNMDHMRISGTEPLSVIIRQKSSFEFEKRCLKSAKSR